jgi:hypothetical protein
MSTELKLTHEPNPFCPQGVTINPGVFIRGGVWYAVLPRLCVAGNDIGALLGMSKDKVGEDINAGWTRSGQKIMSWAFF